jgi:uncharacterized membrane protein YidH (DUF202 family)
MESASFEKPKGLHGVAALFDDKERKDLFRKYLYLLGWVELAILLTCWLYQISDSGREGDTVFPWRLYFVIAFLAPIAITFLLGTAVVGFNKFFAEPEQAIAEARESETSESAGTGRLQQLDRMVTWLRKVPFLGLLLLLAFGVAFFYKLDVILATIGNVGEKSASILLTSLGVLLLLVAVFALILIVLNYRLRKTQMEYQFKGQVAESLGLLILDDNTVLNSSGKLLVNGRKLKAPMQLLPELPKESKSNENSGGGGSIPCPSDLEQ